MGEDDPTTAQCVQLIIVVFLLVLCLNKIEGTHFLSYVMIKS